MMNRTLKQLAQRFGLCARFVAVLSVGVLTFSCSKSEENAPATGNKDESVPSVPVGSLPGHESVALDNTVKEGPRLLPAETYIRSYLQLFGGLSAIDTQTAMRGKDGALFDTWRDYLGALGMPDYRLDIQRGQQTNALMVATFERIGVALCDRAVEKELKDPAKPAPEKRVIFPFDLSAKEPTIDEFKTRFAIMHKTFLGSPLELAETDRLNRFYKLYQDTVVAHSAKDAPKSFTPSLAGWATVCYGLIRHPEFHVY